MYIYIYIHAHTVYRKYMTPSTSAMSSSLEAAVIFPKRSRYMARYSEIPSTASVRGPSRWGNPQSWNGQFFTTENRDRYGGFLEWGYPHSWLVNDGKSDWNGWFGRDPRFRTPPYDLWSMTFLSYLFFGVTICMMDWYDGVYQLHFPVQLDHGTYYVWSVSGHYDP